MAVERPPLPPFTAETARQKVRGAEDGWNSRDPERVSLAYTEDSGAGLSPDKGTLGFHRQPHCRSFRL